MGGRLDGSSSARTFPERIRHDRAVHWRSQESTRPAGPLWLAPSAERLGNITHRLTRSGELAHLGTHVIILTLCALCVSVVHFSSVNASNALVASSGEI